MEMDDYFSSNYTKAMEIFFLTVVHMYTWDIYQVALKCEGKNTADTTYYKWVFFLTRASLVMILANFKFLRDVSVETC